MSDDVVSLFTLMDIHLSKTKLEDVSLENNENHSGRATDMNLPPPPGPQIAIPQFFPGKSPMKDFLAKQISNTLKAKEKLKLQQAEKEQQKLEEQMKKLKIMEQQKLEEAEAKYKIEIKEEEQYLIDLTVAVTPPGKPGAAKALSKFSEEKSVKVAPKSKIIKTSSNLIFDAETCLFKPRVLHLPCTTDISYILKRKIKRGKSSSFGKVFCSRLQAPVNISVPIIQKLTSYNFFKSNFITKNSGNKTVIVPLGPIVDESKVVRFDFSTQSPGDIYLEKKRIQEENFRKPKMHTRFVPDIMDFI